MDKLKKKGNMWLVGMSTCSVFLLGCLITQNKDQVVLVEPIGENRHLEYVKIKLPHTKSSLLLKDTSNGQILQGEQLSQDYKKDSSMYVFPVSLSFCCRLINKTANSCVCGLFFHLVFAV